MFDGAYVPLSIENVSDADLTVFPNPTTSSVTIKGISDFIDLRLIDMKGQIVLTRENISNQIEQISLESLPNGLYIIEIFTTDGVRSTKMITKQ